MLGFFFFIQREYKLILLSDSSLSLSLFCLLVLGKRPLGAGIFLFLSVRYGRGFDYTRCWLYSRDFDATWITFCSSLGLCRVCWMVTYWHHFAHPTPETIPITAVSISPISHIKRIKINRSKNGTTLLPYSGLVGVGKTSFSCKNYKLIYNVSRYKIQMCSVYLETLHLTMSITISIVIPLDHYSFKILWQLYMLIRVSEKTQNTNWT